MFACIQWLLAMLLKIHTTGSESSVGGGIFPRVHFVQKGTNTTIFCKLDNSSLTSNSFWSLGSDITSAQYDRINETVISVTIGNLTAPSVTVECCIYAPDKQLLDAIDIWTGYPPETPQNISCVYYHKENITCTWRPGKDTIIPTTFIVTTETPYGTTTVCNTSTNYCSFFYDSDRFGCEYQVQVEATNELGGAASQLILVNTTRLVKLDPPEVLSLKTLHDAVPSFVLTWRRPTLAPDGLDVKCSLRYSELLAGEWNYCHNIYMEKVEASYNLTGLNAFTEYAMSLRCIGNNGQILWSEWGKEMKGRTAEQAPSHKVELWRVITSNNIRMVHLKWQERPNIKPTGIILGYFVQWFPEDKTAAAENKTTNQNKLSLNISEQAYIISVVYYNSAGSSPKATLRIPASNEKAQNLIDDVQISTRNEDMTVSWNVTRPGIQRFVVEWCVDLETGPCIIFFQYVENALEWTAGKGTFEPYKRYKLSIYPILAERVEASYTKCFYYKEGAPLRGPNARIENVGKTVATIKWDRIGKDEANGFLTTFSIVYKSSNEHESVVTVDSHIYRYTLQLLPNTLYTAYVLASTQAGNTSGEPVEFRTWKYNTEDIGTFIGTIGICVMLVVVAGITYVQRKKKIKHLFWPNIPDPAQSSIAEWPSVWSQTTLIQNSTESDGAFQSDDLQVLDAVYKNERVRLIDEEMRKLLFADMPKSSTSSVSQEGSSQVHYATTERCQEHLPCTPPSSPGSVSSSLLITIAGDLDAEIQEVPHALELAHKIGAEIAEVNPYLKNSVRTREAIHVADSDQ
ncbi:interleukin-31 receptor subunit alpha [Pseudophryne corroboree]|uniref:interleukin-31 receptor subunit alpha n=1 Tax=Pseudophryne corroboree TaxID=495146 RepID=UPI003081925C